MRRSMLTGRGRSRAAGGLLCAKVVLSATENETPLAIQRVIY
jgi:hypothetical protein